MLGHGLYISMKLTKDGASQPISLCHTETSSFAIVADEWDPETTVTLQTRLSSNCQWCKEEDTRSNKFYQAQGFNRHVKLDRVFELRVIVENLGKTKNLMLHINS